MALVEVDHNDQACTVGTLHSLTIQTGGKTYVLALDLNPIVGGATPDILEVLIEVKVKSGSTKQSAYTATYVGGLIVNPAVFSIPVPALYYAEFSIKQTQGTGRTVSWSVMSID